jgi:hypothetical protein
MKKHPIRIIEIHVHKSKKNGRLGHAVALLFPCNHNKYLGLTLFKGDDTVNSYRTQHARIIRFDDYDVMDKEVCKLCPHDELWIDDWVSSIGLDDFADVLEEMEDY